MDNNITKKDIIEGIGFILMVVGIIGLMCLLYEVKGLSKDIKDSLHSKNNKIQITK